MSAVIDASVVLAWLQGERGSDIAEGHMVEGKIGAANWSEVLQKAQQHGAQPGLVARLLTSVGLVVVAVTAEDAERAAELWESGSKFSLADRLCLALGLRLDLGVVTTDRAWGSIPDGPQVIVAR